MHQSGYGDQPYDPDSVDERIDAQLILEPLAYGRDLHVMLDAVLLPAIVAHRPAWNVSGSRASILARRLSTASAPTKICVRMHPSPEIPTPI